MTTTKLMFPDFTLDTIKRDFKAFIFITYIFGSKKQRRVIDWYLHPRAINGFKKAKQLRSVSSMCYN